MFLLIQLAIILVFALVLYKHQYVTCPPNQVLVIYKTTRYDNNPIFIHGGGYFVIPLVQAYQVLSLEPYFIEFELNDALTKVNTRISIPIAITFAISTEKDIMKNAAIRILGLNKHDILLQAKDIIIGRLRLAIGMNTTEEIIEDRKKFYDTVSEELNKGLNEIGMEVINLNLKNIIIEKNDR